MALTIPIYIPVDTLTILNLAIGNSTMTALTVGGAALSRAALTGMRVTYRDGGSVGANTTAVTLYKTNVSDLTTTGEEITQSSMEFTVEGDTLSLMFTQPIPIFQQPYVHLNPAVATSDYDVTFYAIAIAGNS